MMNEYEEKVRKVAEKLWEEKGKPTGQDEEIWHQAEQLIEDEEEKKKSKP
jgi:hypothetical protein